jgi:hypothetical protein
VDSYPQDVILTMRVLAPRNLFAALLSLGVLATLSLAASPSPAGASVTIGQRADPNAGNCDAGVDFVQLGVSSGNQYVVPGAGTITSWTVEAVGDRGVLTMKIFRKLADPARFQVVGHAGPQTRTAGGTAANTFPANIRVRPGDLLGLHTVTATPCAFKDPGGQPAMFSGDLADGEAAEFGLQTEFDLDIQAVFVPDNAFSLGATTRNKKRGTATITVNVPNPGELTGSGKDVKVAGAAVISKTVTAPGDVKLTIRAKGKKKRKLNDTGKVTVKPNITYTPTGGDPSTQSRKLILTKKR